MVQITDITKCFIVLTNTAREAMKEHFTDEHAFFSSQNSFYVYLEKLSIEETSLSITIYFDPERNPKLTKKMNERIVIMDCIFDIKNGLVAKSFRTRGKNTPVKTNRRKGMHIHFVPSRMSGHSYSPTFIQTLAELPVAKEKYDYVNKRITSWEGYLKVLYKNANIEDIEASIQSVSYNADISNVRLRLQGISQKEWRQLKGLSAYTKGYKYEIGEVVKANENKQTVEIELTPAVSKLAKQDLFDFETDRITFSNASTKSQLNRLLKGFERLKEGLAANPNLENFLFEDQIAVNKRKNNLQIEFHNNLNKYQREAVTGALEAEDLYVIQGPPGTGKTTVISEICYQNVKRGLKTLIASQSNLAVDNALGRLLSNKDIRILRYGRTDSIEEEGKKFIEENVAEYWKAQTYEAISNEIAQHDHKEESLQKEIKTCYEQIEAEKEKIKQLQEDIQKKQQAEEELQRTIKTISELKKQIGTLNKERDKTEKSIEILQNSLKERKDNLNEMEKALSEQEEIQSEIDKAKKNIENSQNLMSYIQTKQQIEDTECQLQQVVNEIHAIQSKKEGFDEILDELQSYKKVDEVEAFIEKQEIKRGYILHQLFVDMEKNRQQILELRPVKQISKRIEKAILYHLQILNIPVGEVVLPENYHYTLNEIEEFLDKLARAFKEQKINRNNGVPAIRGLYLRRIYVNQLLIRYQALIDDTKLVFHKIKKEVEEQLLEKAGLGDKQLKALQEKESFLQNTVQQLEKTLYELPVENTDFLPAISELQEVIHSLNEKIHQLSQQQEQYQTYQEKVITIKKELAQVTEELSRGEEQLKTIIGELKELNRKGIRLEQLASELQQIIKQNPELELEQRKEKIKALQENVKKLKQQLDMLPITKEIQKEWFSLLKQASDQDLDEIRKLYVKHANVIGTTCVASANKEFMDNYPTFDVVIIDEVSKATPPELLLPMLKGKKIVLVGDHHQLPPLIGDDTFEETLEAVMKETDTFEEKRELEKLLEESLFERLYKNLPSSNKQMLAIQYRMHEDIMQTIAPFYQNGNDSLHCGLSNSDEVRDHKLTGQYIQRNEHLLWFDLPNESPFFEERMKEGASLYNPSELAMIRQLLMDLNDATEKAKKQGLMDYDAVKGVGVISFYREQVNRVNALIEELNLPHLHLRTGSVDKFQGMEMDVILLSMVRNHDNKQGDIGFAKDYRRLNVALSRARELLLLIGSSDMFTKRPKKEETRKMYENLLDVVNKQAGVRKITKETLNELKWNSNS